MSDAGKGLGIAIIVAGLSALLAGRLRGEPPDVPAALTVRLVHPEQQAAEVMRLFEGARAPHPAAVLAAWKRSTHDTGVLGKPLEALITAFNPEMAAEWRVLNDAELCVDLNGAGGGTGWNAVIARDDGTIAAAITSLRLTDGANEASLEWNGRRAAVERLGPPGAIVAARAGDSLILGSSRAELLRGFRSACSRGSAPVRPDNTAKPGAPLRTSTDQTRDSGVFFELDPDGLGAAATAPLALRRAGELLRGLACRRTQGRLALEGDCVALTVTTPLEPGKLARSIAQAPAVVESAWLKWIPSADVLAVASIALAPSAGLWDWAFGLADRVDRADPARAELAPLRTRANLLAAAVLVRPEVDLWPHLHGVTACLLADGKHVGSPAGGLLVLHVDADPVAKRLSDEFLPRLALRFLAKKPAEARGAAARMRPEAAAGLGNFVYLGTLNGRAVAVGHEGRDVLIAWGDDTPAVARAAAADPRCSAKTVCTAWETQGKPAPQRLGAIWPARAWAPPAGANEAAAWQILADDPPILWWGWNGRSLASDSIRWPGLRKRAQRAVDALLPDPSSVRSQP